MFGYFIAILLIAAVSPATVRSALAEETPEVVVRDQVRFNADRTYSITETVDHRIARREDIGAFGRFDASFQPRHQTLEVCDAWVEQPNGDRMLYRTTVFWYVQVHCPGERPASPPPKPPP